jgi:hypothetical protein
VHDWISGSLPSKEKKKFKTLATEGNKDLSGLGLEFVFRCLSHTYVRTNKDSFQELVREGRTKKWVKRNFVSLLL